MMPLLQQNVTVAVGQLVGSDSVEQNLSRIDEMAGNAARAHAKVIVFPEAVMYDFKVSAEQLSSVAEAWSDRFDEEVSRIASRHNLAIVAGSYSPAAQNKTKNCLVAFGPDGALLARYEKLHLYNAFSFRESDKHDETPLQPDASELKIIDVAGFRFGLINCYDLRFPEMSRLLIDRGADFLLVASGWVAGPLKDRQWEILLKARAIENTCYVIASCQPAPLSVGLSMVVDPMGTTIAGIAENEGVAVAELSLERQRQVREILPCLSQRRYFFAPSA
ncbi:MAG TPA: carbon-nitrogen hydrolase family protein [Ensifer sp.]|nr:carbon-nitrogen hydrolase family protein [Ensifer sp.]